MKNLIYALILLTGLSFAQDTIDNPDITTEEIQNHIKYLSSDEFEGRFAGTEQNQLAAEYIKDQFESYGLIPFYNGSYFQEFEFIQSIKPGENNNVSITQNNVELNLELDNDFVTAPFSGSGSVTGELAFAGYGIASNDLEYNDFAGIDVKDKIVIIMRYNPDHDSAMSKFDRYSSLRVKASAARDSGAAGVIFVNGFEPNEDDELIEFKYDRGPQMKFPLVHIKRSYINDILQNEGYNFREIQAEIDSTKQPNSFIIEDVKVTLQTEVEQIQAKANNVAGYIEGNDPTLKDSYIVIGAHFDHIGWGETGSMYRGDEPMIHNGADDNASGTTGVMELAERLSAEKNQLKHSIVFMAFNAEELGLLGSSHTVNNFPVDVESVVAMINMDMIGRVNEDKDLTIIGTGTSSIWEDLLNELNTYDFKLKFNSDGFGGSDHQSFTLKEVPVLFFFTGIHSDYHRPSDDWDKINLEGQKNILHYIYSVVKDLDGRSERPDYVKVEREAHGGRGGYSKVYVGTIPEFGWQGEGFKLGGVSEGGPAQKAGLQSGDIMIKFGDKKVANIYDFMYAMQEHKPGDVVKVIVLRDGKEKEFDITLEARN